MSLRALSFGTLLALGLASLPGLHAGAPAPERRCARPVPAPVLKAQAGLSGLTFQAVSDHEATEGAILDGTTSLSITHWGCQDLMLTFAVESKTLPDQTRDVPAGYREAASQIRRLISLKANTGFNLEKAAAALEAQAKKAKGLAYVRPVGIPGAPMDHVTVQGYSHGKLGTRLTFEFLRVLPRKKHPKARKK
ncbi:MAG TPA: hypothetical protein VF768_10765 [Holophagaceae bacterium]